MPSIVDQVVGDFIPYACSEMNNSVNGILTPTTPSTKSIANANPFFVPPPFQPYSFSHSPSGCFQVSPIEFSPSDKPSSFANNYCDEGSYYKDCEYSSVADTPDSVFEGGHQMNQFDYDDNYFKFDPDTVEKFMPQSDILNLDEDYVNYNEDNCNSKNQSPCSSPMDPWIMSNVMADYHNVTSKSPRIDNTQQFVQIQSLPSINQAFATHFVTKAESANIPPDNSNNTVASYEQNFIELFDSTLFDDFGIEKPDSNVMETNNHYINPANYNFVDTDVKPNREFKNIWSEDKLSNAPALLIEINQTAADVPASPMKPKTMQKILQEPDDSEQQLFCFWKDCNKEFNSQATLVSHIEKTHVCSAKGDEYTCLWTECPRQYRSFNARYKLLIHMRVHSGEKPNKCPVRKFFSLLIVLKLLATWPAFGSAHKSSLNLLLQHSLLFFMLAPNPGPISVP